MHVCQKMQAVGEGKGLYLAIRPTKRQAFSPFESLGSPADACEWIFGTWWAFPGRARRPLADLTANRREAQNIQLKLDLQPEPR